MEWYHRIHGLNYIALRYFNAAGADPDGETGEWHDPETHLIPNVLKAARQQTPVEINGNDFPTNDGTAIRDYIHVSDLAEAHVLALEKARKNDNGRAYNLGSGKGYSIMEIIKAAEKISGENIKFVYKSRRPGDPPELVASADRAKADLGWQPKFSDIDTIMGTAWQWMEKN